MPERIPASREPGRVPDRNQQQPGRVPGRDPGLEQPAQPARIPGRDQSSSRPGLPGSRFPEPGVPGRPLTPRKDDQYPDQGRVPPSFVFDPTTRTSTTQPPSSQGSGFSGSVGPVRTTTARTTFELQDAVTRRTTAQPQIVNNQDAYDYYDYNQDLIDDNNVVPPTIFVPQIPTYGSAKPDQEDESGYILDSVPVDDNRVFDRRLNFLGGSSANIVEATVVEDLNYARSIRESKQSRIGIATISSITVGIIALLAFGLIIFLALARRRRRKEEATTASSANMTPTHSR